MKRAAFATLCGVSRPMISKYESGGFIVVDGDDVDAAASLAALEGRLDEDKRQRALAALGEVEAPRSAAAPTSAADAPRAASAKAQKDEVELRLKQLQYGREAGELVSAEAVDAAARQAVTSLSEAFANRRREIAERICLQLGAAPDKASAIARLLGVEFEETLGVFAREMLTAASPDPAAANPAIPSASVAEPDRATA
jgi:transcriptional regulator with XRE-family HTH domain